MDEKSSNNPLNTPEEMSKIMLAAGPERPLLLVIYHTMAGSMRSCDCGGRM